MTVKYFIFPFGVDGDRAAIPDPTQVSGVVSYEAGFPVGYQLVDTDPASLNIPRDEFNQLVYDITLAIQQVQQNGFPVFITSAMNGGSPFPYAKNSFVRQPTNGNVYFSLIDSNTDVPPTSNWQLFINGNGLGGSLTTGMMVDYWGTALPSGYVWPNGQTIGNASSNATGLADASTSDLFGFFWVLSPSLFPMFTSTGTPQARGANAAADFAANYQITLPDVLERVTAGVGTMGGVTNPNRITTGGSGISGATLGASGGVEVYALTIANEAIHNHDGSGLSGAAHNHVYSGSSSTAGAHSHSLLGSVDAASSPPTAYMASHSLNETANSGSISVNGDHTHSFSGTTDNATVTISGATGNTGSGTPHQNTQPTIMVNKILKL